MKRIGIVLCGSGYKDGSEIREAVATFWALSQHPVEIKCFAPNDSQYDVVNCFTGQVAAHETRNMLVEAARIARGKIEDLSHCKAENLDAIIFPGGFGAAKNLCTFGLKGGQGSIRADVKSILEKMHAAKKPIGAICIAPAILALAFKDQGFQLTVGAQSEASIEIEKLGHKHIECQAKNCIVDDKNRIVTSPAYMFDDAPLFEIFEGIQKLVGEVIKMSEKST